jgi:hypothetical protein
MGFFGRLFGGKRKDEPTEPAATAATEQPTSFNFGVLPEIAAILTNMNESALADVSLLASRPEEFMRAHQDWFDGMDWGDSAWFSKHVHKSTLLSFAYWLAGYEAVKDAELNPKLQFAAYIDWKEAPTDIVWQLSRAARNLGCAAELEGIAFDENESTEEGLSKISERLAGQGRVLLSLDTDSDCYHLFIVQAEDLDRLMRLAAKVDFKFFRLPE